MRCKTKKTSKNSKKGTVKTEQVKPVLNLFAQIKNIVGGYFSDAQKEQFINQITGKNKPVPVTVPNSKTVKPKNVIRNGRPTLNALTINLLEGNGRAGTTLNDIVDYIVGVYPEKDIKTVTNTTIRRLKGEMRLPENTEIISENIGNDIRYFLREKTGVIVLP